MKSVPDLAERTERTKCGARASLYRVSPVLRLTLALLLLALSTTHAAVVQNFSRYSVILERRPFGEAPSAADSAPSPVAPTGPSFADSLQLCAFTEVGGSLRVGFLDTNTKKTYFLFVGESEGGIEVVDANYDDETAVLRKDGDQRELRMGGAGGVSVAVNSGSHNTDIPRRPRVLSRARRVTRTKEQIEEDRRLAIERKSPILKGEEYEAHMRRYNMELIRQGGVMGVPLPMTLTSEEDAQLVAEGVLAPPAPGGE